MRNAIYLRIDGTNPSDFYRIEVKVTYEYIPTFTFKQWVDLEPVRATV